MCEADANQPLRLLAAAAVPVRASTRRRRLWELPANCHCPVIGVCVPLAVLRRLVDKAVRGSVQGDDYEVHIGAVADCISRNRLSQLLQEALDQRYCAVLHRFSTAADGHAVRVLWSEALHAGDVAGAFWAALTHPCTDFLLEATILGEIHMLQHQAGAETRVDLARHHALKLENAVLAQENARQARELAARSRALERAAAQLERARAELAARAHALTSLQATMDALRATVPELAARTRLQQQLDEVSERERKRDQLIASLRQQLAAAQAAPMPAEALTGAPAKAPAAAPFAPEPDVRLDDKTILCVGGRSGNVPNYRDITEQAGARFAHHDGALHDGAAVLDASLAAADLVICQTGCISHGAYWRVKDHCKRTGKQCVFVENPSSASFSRGLRQIALVALPAQA